MSKRAYDSDDGATGSQKPYNRHTWSTGALHHHDSSIEIRNAKSSDLCFSDHKITVRMLMGCCRLLCMIQLILTRGMTPCDVVNATPSTLKGILSVAERKRLLNSLCLCVSRVKEPSTKVSSCLIKLPREGAVFTAISSYMKDTIRPHNNDFTPNFSSYDIHMVQQLFNPVMWSHYVEQRECISIENGGNAHELFLFHGSKNYLDILNHGFDEKYCKLDNLFGSGIYLCDISSKANLYIFGQNGGSGCVQHKDKGCTICPRHLLLCRTALGASYTRTTGCQYTKPPRHHHSVAGLPSVGGLMYPEYCLYTGAQIFPQFLVTYQLRE